ncbi:MAG: hypothetical protein EP312_05265 [Gammaproteobacteria bacterium]|nr:MAG: hypothetical protein EP312_05265 [Gammaproteobacteria bacterium]
MIASARRLLDTHINYRMAFAGALVLGLTVFAINVAHGTAPALVAAGKQALYTFLVAGFITRHNERLAVRYANPWRAMPMAVGSSCALAIGLTYLVHSLKGTPEPLLSTLPTILMAPPAFTALAWRARSTTAAGASGT